MAHINKINDKIDIVKLELSKLENQCARGALLRSKVKWQQEEGHGTKYFLNLEKTSARMKTMSAIRLSNGEISRNTQTILEHQIRFYESLYMKDDSIRFKGLENNVKISHLECTKLEEVLTKVELGLALKDMNRNKSPGPDGLTADFYKMFWCKIATIMYDACVDSYNKGLLFLSARRGMITLIPKKDQDALMIKNWRPICLLNVDYKILSKALVACIKQVLPSIINEDQTGFVSGRNIAQNVRKALDLIKYVELHQIEAMLISVDFEKAFNRVDYQAMSDILKFFGVGPKYLAWIQLLFRQFFLATINAGHVSRFMSPTRGLFQGNPIASFLFITIIGCLAKMLRSNKDIPPIQIKGIKLLLSQFADDLDIFSKYNQKNLDAILDTLKAFEACSGMKVNIDKTTIYRIGSARKDNAKLYTRYKIQWSDKPLNLLGVIVSNDLHLLNNLNIMELMAKADRILKLWTNRNLSLLAKIQVVNSLVYSLFAYRMNVLDKLEDKFIRMFNAMIEKFTWNNRRPKILLQI